MLKTFNLSKNYVIPNSARNPLIKNEEMPKQVQHNRDNKELYDEDGYLIASLEEGIADYEAKRTITFKSWEDKMKYIDEVIKNDVPIEF